MKFVLASHGGLSEGMLDTISMFLGPQKDIEAYVLSPDEEAARLGERLAEAIGPEDEGNVIFFTDIYFGSPFNQVVELSRHHDIYHVTGMNVAVLVEAIMARNAGKTCEEICKDAVEAGLGGIKDVRAMLASDSDASSEEEEDF